jgi:chitodextrinase
MRSHCHPWQGFALLVLLAPTAGPAQSATVACTGLPAWSSTTFYAVGAKVTYGGSLYRALASSGNVPPATCSTGGWWQLLGTCASTGTCSAVPPAPNGLRSPAQTSASVTLAWNAVTTPANCSVTYTVRQNGSAVSTVPTTTAILSGLTPSTTYSFTVTANDAAGHSAPSPGLAVTTRAGGGGTPTPAAVLAGIQARMTSATQVNSKPHLNTMNHQVSVNVNQVLPGIFAFNSGMAIDTDGSDADPDPDHGDQTMWQDSNGQQLGAHHVPYYVLGDVCTSGGSPCSWFYYPEHQITGLQFALVFYNGKAIGAVFGDTQGPPGGDARELGEASVRTADLLGIPSSGTTGGVDSGVTYVVFSGAPWVLSGSNATLSDQAQALVPKALAALAAGFGQ